MATPTPTDLAGKIENWRGASARNETTFRSAIAETLPGDDATVKSATVEKISEVEPFGQGYKALLSVNAETEHRTDESEPDTFGPNDLTDWGVRVLIDVDPSGNVADMSHAPGD